jgi:hypothetical protein
MMLYFPSFADFIDVAAIFSFLSEQLSFGTHSIDLVKRLFQDLPVEKDQRAKCLILGGCSDVFVNSQMGQKGFDLMPATILWMAPFPFIRLMAITKGDIL